MQHILLDILEYVVAICRENNLCYYAFFGTLLGCIRHEGFIPWDDDLDIVMPRKDYDRLREVLAHRQDERYEWSDYRREDRTFWGGYIKIWDRNSTCIGYQTREERYYCRGIGMDILPLDYVEEDNGIREKHLQTIQKLHCKNAKALEKQLTVSQRIIRYKLEKAYTNCESKKSNYVGLLTRNIEPEKQRFFKESWFEEPLKRRFCDIELNVPREYDQCLHTVYGRRYMEIPSKEEQKSNHNYFLDTTTAYEHYLVAGEPLEKNNIIIWGCEKNTEQFINLYKDRNNIYCCIDEARASWGRTLKNIIIKGPDDFERMEYHNYLVVICTEKVKRAKEKMATYGVSNYKIFWNMGER